MGLKIYQSPTLSPHRLDHEEPYYSRQSSKLPVTTKTIMQSQTIYIYDNNNLNYDTGATQIYIPTSLLKTHYQIIIRISYIIPRENMMSEPLFGLIMNGKAESIAIKRSF